MIGVFTTVTLSIVLANSDPGYSKYYRLFNNRQKGYSGYGSVSLPKQNYQDPYYRSVGNAYKELPSRRVKNHPHQNSQYRAYHHNHARYHDQPRKYFSGAHNTLREIELLRHQHYGKHGKYNSYAQPKPYPKPHPVPHPEPHPMPHPIPHPSPHPVPHPEPHPVPHPIPHPEPHPMPRPEPHPIPHPHPQPIINPITIPSPSPTPQPIPQPQPIPFPTPSPLPLPLPKPEPIPVPAPDPFPQPAPIPVEVPEIVPEEDLTLPVPPAIIKPMPIVERPDIELPPESVIPIRPIETIGRPPVAPSLKPPNFVELQRSVPGFVDIQKMNVDIRPLGEPTNRTPGQQVNTFQTPIPGSNANQGPIPVEPIPERPVQIETLFPVGDANFGDVISGQNTPIETLFPVDEIPSLDSPQRVRPVLRPETPSFQRNPVQNNVRERQRPRLNNIGQQPRPNILRPEIPNFQRNPVQSNVRERQRPRLNNIGQQPRPNVPLLAKAVPAVPESNPQPLFKNGNVNPETATATALLLQASMADFGNLLPTNPSELSPNVPRTPVQPVPSPRPQVGFRRLPSVMLPDPVPAVPLGQP